MKYIEHFFSKEWTEKCNLILKEQNYICDVCGRYDYEIYIIVNEPKELNPVNESRDNLTVICNSCHTDMWLKKFQNEQ